MVTADEIREIAANARLQLTGDEVEELEEDVADILDSFAALDEIDTEGVDPSLHPIPHEDRVRGDEEEECLAREETLQNTQNTEDGYFKGPRSVE